MPDVYRIKVKGEADFSAIRAEALKTAKQIAATTRGSLTRAGNAGVQNGATAPLIGNPRDHASRQQIREAVGSGKLSIREGALVQRAVRSMFVDLDRQFREAVQGVAAKPSTATKAATRATARAAAAAKVGLSTEDRVDQILDRERKKRRETRSLAGLRTGEDHTDWADLRGIDRRRKIARDRIVEGGRTEADNFNEGQLAADRRRNQRAQNDAKRAATELQAEAAEANATRAFRRRQNIEQARQLGIPRGEGAGAGLRYILQRQEGSSRFQRAESLLGNRGGPPRAPGDNATLGQALGGGLITSARFAIAGAALYGALATITDIVGEAERLNRVMLLVEEQFNAVGDSSSFKQFRSEILAISRDTGIVADEVATVGFQMKGAFGDTARAIAETRGAFKVSLVTGLEQRELTDSLTAGAKAYGTSIEEIGDKAIGLEERFGVLARESLKVFGDLASVANEAGLSLNELGAIVGVIQQASGRGGAAIAEGLGRVLPAISDQAVAIVQLYRQVPALVAGAGQVTEALGAGRTGDVLLQLVADYDKLDSATQKYVISLLGGRREAQLLIPLFANASKVVKEQSEGLDDAGKTSKRYSEIQKSATQTVKRFREELRQFGDALARGGLLDAFLVLAGGAELLVKTLGAGVRLFGDLNDAAGGVPAKLVAIALGIKAIEIAIASMGKARVSGGVAPAIVQGVVSAAGYGVGPGAGAASSAAGPAAAGLIARRVAAARAASDAARQAAIADVGFRAGGSGLAGSSRIAGGAAGGFAALGVSAPAVIAASVLATGAAYVHQNKGVADEAKDLRERIKEYDEARVREIAESRVTFWDHVAEAVFGEPTPAGFGENELRRRSPKSQRLQEELKGYVELYGKDDPNSGDMARLLKLLESGREGAVKQVEEELKSLSGEPGYIHGRKVDASTYQNLKVDVPKELGGNANAGFARKLLAGRKSLQQRKAAAEKLADEEASATASYAGAIETLDSVQTAFEAGEVGYEKLIDVQRQQVQILKEVAGADPDRLKALAEARRTLNKTISESVLGAIGIVQEMVALTAGGNDPLAALPTLNAALASLQPQTTRTTLLPKKDFARFGLDPGTKLPEFDVKSGGDPIAAKEVADIYAKIQSDAFQKSIKNAKSADEALTLARGGVALDPSVRQAYIDYQIARFGKVLFEPPEKLTADKDQLDQLVAQQLQERIGALQAANRDVIDPLTNAVVGVQIAQMTLDAANLEGKKGAIDAATVGYAQAQRAVQEAQTAIFDAQHQLAVAIADAAGDTVKSARLTATKAASDLQKLKDAKAGQAAIDIAAAQRVTADAGVRDARFAEERRKVEVDLALERVSTSNAIARLSDIPNQIADLTQQQRDELAIQIKALRDQTAGDFKLNAGDIKLPTLYQVRRLAESERQGTGYNDNRKVDIKFYVGSDVDIEKVRTIVAESVQAPSRVLGARVRAY